MDTHNQKPEISSLQRAVRSTGEVYSERQAFIPRESVTPNGTTVFRTSDKKLYMRHTDGSIRRVKERHGNH